MFRNVLWPKINLQLQQKRFISKNALIVKQSKILGKLYGDRVSGTKRKWFAPPEISAKTENVVFKQSQFGKPKPKTGKNVNRRMKVLNKLFMEHITDLMATGEVSTDLLGKGLQVTRVRISPDFAFVNVFWVTTGDVDRDKALDVELQRCSGLLRHELSQLRLMGVVPRIKFVKDKLNSNMAEVEAILNTITFNDDDNADEEDEGYVNVEYNTKSLNTECIKQEFYGLEKDLNSIVPANSEETSAATESLEHFDVPKMRHDVLGLDHKAIMLKIFTKMRKSKQAWESYQQGSYQEQQQQQQHSMNDKDSLVKLNKTISTEDAEKFATYLVKRQEQKNIPERKKFRSYAQRGNFNDDDGEVERIVVGEKWKELYEGEDYLVDEDQYEKK